MRYFSWAKAGFDMKLTDNPRKMENWSISTHFPFVPEKLDGCNSVQDVFGLGKGADFWRLCGDGDYMEFDLASGSNSWDRLNSSLKEGTQMRQSKNGNSGRSWGDQSAAFSGELKAPQRGAVPVAQAKRMTLTPLPVSSGRSGLPSVYTNVNRKGAELPDD